MCSKQVCFMFWLCCAFVWMQISHEANAQSVIISEVSSDNEFLDDEDDHDPDWIELLNISTAPVDLGGWYLTDADDNLTRWEIPSISLAPGEMIVIFASGKDRTNPAAPLHTNFSIDADGEYLALVRPDGVTIEDDLGGDLPKMPMDVTYGRAFGNTDTLVPLGASVDIHVPTSDTLGLTWTADSFTTTSPDWFTGQTPVGFQAIPDLVAAGTLYVDLDASGLPEGDLTTWNNAGTLGTAFSNISSIPDVQTILGVKAVNFDGDDAMRLDALVPADMSGVEDWSIEVWAYNEDISTEEIMVGCWHRAGNGAGSLNYGDASVWGAFGAWDNDLPYSDVPSAGNWHHIVLTNEGGLGGDISVYVDGELDNSRPMVVALRSAANAMAVMLGRNSTNSGLTPSPNSGQFFTGALAKVRIHSEDLSAGQVRNNYLAEIGQFDGSQLTGIEIAGGLLVDLDAADASAGEATWINNGTLGDFSEVFGDAVKETIDGAPAVTFDSFVGYQGPASPLSITGGGDRTIEVWAWNPVTPGIRDEETMVSWARRGVQNRHMVFNYGSHGGWGAIANWGEGDMPWTPSGGYPELGVWHHLAYVYTGSSSRLFVDGALTNSENISLDTFNGYPILLGIQTNTDDTLEFNPARMAELSMSRIRVHDEALTDAQVGLNYLYERSDFFDDTTQTTFATDLASEMHGVNPGVYLRIPFEIAGDPSALYNYLMLRIQYDDGFVAYINGVKVAERNAPVSPAHDSMATAETGFLSELETDSIVISQHLSALQSGTNVLAIHGLNAGDDNFDFVIAPELLAAFVSTASSWYLSEPTPGIFNTHHVPGILDVEHMPEQPTPVETATVTAEISDPNGITSVTLSYQVVLPGSYIPAYLPLDHNTLQFSPSTPNAVNPDYTNPANWTTVPMFDDGTNGDTVAGDGEYAAVLPARAHRTLVRYRINVLNGAGVTVTAPYPLDPNLNYAYYVYDGVPAFTANESVTGSPRVYPESVMTSLPVYQLLSREQDIEQANAWESQYRLNTNSPNATYIEARRKENWFGTFVYDGIVYDNISYRMRGTNARYVLDGKRSWKVKFNRGNYFQARDMYGKKYPTQWRRLLIGKMFSNLQAWWNGSEALRPYSDFGLVESTGNKLFNLYDVPAPFTHWFHFRVVDGVDEAPAGPDGQYHGDFWGMFLAIEEYDRNFLEAHDLPDGNLYKLSGFVDSGLEQVRYQAADAVKDASDYDNIRFNFYSPAQTETFLKENADYDEWYRYHSITDAIRHWDHFPEPSGANRLKNLTWYFHPSETNPLGRVWFLPFDLDSTWGPTFNQGLDQGKWAIYNAFNHVSMQLEYRNHLRELRDLLFRPEVVDPMIDEFAALIADFVPADRDRWENHPDTPYYAGPLEEKVTDMREFAWIGDREWAFGGGPPFSGYVPSGGQAAFVDALANAGGDATSIPNTPSATYTGSVDYATNNLTFTSSAFSDPQGAGTFTAVKWRMGEITDPASPAYDPDALQIYEITEIWSSGELGANNEIAIPAGTALPGHTYRVRVRHKDNTGRWSHWSEPHEFTATEPDTAFDLEQYLRVSELMYHAPPGNEFDFLELHNISDSTAIEFNGEVFTAGISFTIPPGVQIPPLGYLLLANDPSLNYTAFKTYYGLDDSAAILGPYGGNLSNGGERLELSRTADGQKLIALEYSDGRGWDLQADGAGHSLVPLRIMDIQTDDSLNFGANWRPSTYIKGSPGAADPAWIDTLLVTEVSPHTDTGLPAPADSNDWFEIVNTTTGAVSLTDWYVSDNGDILTKYELADGFASIAAGGRLSFDELTHFNNPAGSGFGLSKAGEQLFLSYLPAGNPGAWRVADVARFKGVENEGSPMFTTWGRTPEDGRWWRLTTESRDQPQSAPRMDVVISEFMYHPLLDNPVGEYIELWNPTNQAIDLFHSTEGPWRIDGGADFVLPGGITLAPDERILLVNFDPDNPTSATMFTSLYGTVPGSMHGPFDTGVLSNEGERLALERPQPEDEIGEGISWVIVDEVIYFDQFPWTPDADGTGLSLQRLDEGIPGNDWDNWFAVPPNPNSVLVIPTVELTTGDVAKGGATASSPVSMTATFSEPVAGFDAGGIDLTNAVVDANSFVGSDGDTVFTFDVYPVAMGAAVVSIPAGAAQSSAAGVPSRPSGDYGFDYTNSTVLTYVMTSGDVANGSSTIIGEIDMSVMFSEAVDGFAENDIQLTNATIEAGSFTGSDGDTAFTFTVNPSAFGQVAVEVPILAAQTTSDGVYNLQASNFSFQFVDAPPLTFTIGSTDVVNGGVAAASPVRIGVMFSEAVDGFMEDDIILTNASIAPASFVGGDGDSEFLFDVVPAAAKPVTVTVHIPAMAATTSSFGLSNLDSMDFSFLSVDDDSTASATPWQLLE